MSVGFKGSNFAKPQIEAGNPVGPLSEQPRFVPLPPFTGLNTTLSLEAILPGSRAEIADAGRIVFHATGDTGGVHGTETQTALGTAMAAQITNAAAADLPRFMFHLGDVVYFNGLSTHYVEQFYEPYQYYNAPIFAIPGNHDGDTQTRKGDEEDNEPSLYGFMKNFCSPTPDIFFKHRSTMTQPYCYWKLEAPFVHIIGLYSNVDGLLDARGTMQQQRWLVEQLRGVPRDKWLIVAVHHPCFSLDSYHGGYPEILQTLDTAFASAGQVPDLVLSGHVHDYQRFARTIGGKSVPYVVNGNGGFANTERALHKLQPQLAQAGLPFQTKLADVSLQFADTARSGFLRLTAGPDEMLVEYFALGFDNAEPVLATAADHVKVAVNGGAKTP